ncbi:MAG: hypothetical protein GWP06_17860 [Actinobacteria bacterium]|nr:hypothetical protein [Actinomycetota bacterium]
MKLLCRNILFITLFLLIFTGSGNAQTTWSVILSNDHIKDEAIRVVLDDLQNTGKQFGLQFKIINDGKAISDHSIIVGSPVRNRCTADLAKARKIRLQGIDNPEGYEIMTRDINGNRIIVVAGGSLIGDVYGLYWIWDRLRVYKKIPELNVKRAPVFKIRHAYLNSKKKIRQSLRYCINYVSGQDALFLVPWHAEPENTETLEKRREIKDVIEYAHSLHIKYFTNSYEFFYHPSLLKEYGATLSPSDPAFWDALQAKYRMLLRAMPELDGVCTGNGELTGVTGNYKAFDIMLDGECCDWSLEKRYRTFVKKMYNVVVKEFNRDYFQATWVTNSYEQHSQPDIYKKIFTRDVPTKNFYVVPMITQNDRWWFQPYNPTFNLTPHNMIAVFQMMSYHESQGTKLFPTFPGAYFQAALQTIEMPKKSNLKGISCVYVPEKNGWNSLSLNAYTAYRLEWNYNENLRDIARDFASIHFGPKAADGMADILLLSPVAYKYGLYIEPVTYGAFNSLIQMRVDTFPAMGYPNIDNGKEHIHSLRTIYLRCKPWIPETLIYLDHGVETANSMLQIFQNTRPLFADAELAQRVENSLQYTRLLVQTNNYYVRTFFAYFEYWDNPTSENKNKLVETFTKLTAIRNKYKTLQFHYNLFGINHLLINVEQALQDLPKAKEKMATLPNSDEITQIIKNQQKKYTRILQEHSNDAVKFLHWQGKVDGRDILKIKGKNIEIEHLRWDPIYAMDYKFLRTLPEKKLTVIPKDIESRPMHPFILEQPCRGNNYTAQVYLYDIPGGYGTCEFDLYYIAKSPKELGLEIPWQTKH